MITTRLLPPEEWEKLRAFFPYNQSDLPDPQHWLIVAAEDDGRLVRCCAIFDAVHWDGFAILPAYQKHPAVFGGLLRTSKATLRERGIAGVHVTVPDDQPDLQQMVEDYGFIKAPGTLYLYQVPTEEPASVDVDTAPVLTAEE